MTIILSPEASAQWQEGGWLSLEIQEDILNDLDRENINEVVVVTLATGTVAFSVSQREVI